jgi:hypothetical protein
MGELFEQPTLGGYENVGSSSAARIFFDPEGGS